MQVNKSTISVLMEQLDYGNEIEKFPALEKWLSAKNGSLGSLDSQSEVSVEISDKCSCQIKIPNSETVVVLFDKVKASYQVWHMMGAEDKSFQLFGLLKMFKENSSLVCDAETLTTHKTSYDVKSNDIPNMVRLLQYYVGFPMSKDANKLDNKEPLGTCVFIYPSGVSLLDFMYKFCAAVAAGNCVIVFVKPENSLPIFVFNDICLKSGLCPGLLHVVPMSSGTLDALLEVQGIGMVHLTGFRDEVRKLQEQLSPLRIKMIVDVYSSPFIFVTGTADIDSAVDETVQCICISPGQPEVFNTRLFVESSVYEKFLTKLRQRLENVRIENVGSKNCDKYRLSDRKAKDLDEHINKAKDYGVVIERFGSQDTAGSIVLMTNGGTVSNFYWDCIPGPVLYCLPFRTILDGLKLVNNCVFGTCGSVWSRHVGSAIELAKEINAGTIWLNTHHKFGPSAGPTGFNWSSSGAGSGLRSVTQCSRSLMEESPVRSTIDPMTFGVSPSDGSKDSGQPAEGDKLALKVLVNGALQKPTSGLYFQHNFELDGRKVTLEIPNCSTNDIKASVDAATASLSSWKKKSGSYRSQILYGLAMAFRADKDKYIDRLNIHQELAEKEFHTALMSILSWAAEAERDSGSLVDHHTPSAFVFKIQEAVGVIGIVCGTSLSAFVNVVCGAIAFGNTVVVAPYYTGDLYPLLFAKTVTKCEMPRGVINLITVDHKHHACRTLSRHHSVHSLWYFGDWDDIQSALFHSSENNKRLWLSNFKLACLDNERLVTEATRIKQVWMPGGTIYAN